MPRSLPALRLCKPRQERGEISPIEGARIPFAVIEGESPGPVLVVTAGIHGSEYTSIEAALRLARRSPRGLAGTVLVLPIMNMGAFRSRAIYVAPEDGRNLNRMFPGRPDGSFTERLAHWLTTAIYPQADAYLDLHGGDLSEALAPFSLFPRDSAASRELALVFGLPIAVAAGGEGYTINAAGRLGKPSVLAEVGGNGVWTEAGAAQFSAGIERVLAHLGMTETKPAAPVSGRVLYRLSSLWVNQGEALLGIGTPTG